MSNFTLTKRLSLYDAFDCLTEMLTQVDNSIAFCVKANDMSINEKTLVAYQGNLIELENIFYISDVLGIKSQLLDWCDEYLGLKERLEFVQRETPQCWYNDEMFDWPEETVRLDNDLTEGHLLALFDSAKEKDFNETYSGAVFRIAVIKLCNLLRVHWWEFVGDDVDE